MKGFALVLLCVVAAAQARSAVQVSSRARAELGENPWVVHLRFSVWSNGFLDTCAGSLIDNTWILTAKDCLTEARFIWSRYGVVRVWNPELVLEGGQVILHPELNVALIRLNRVVDFSDNISAVGLASSADEVESAKFCAFGEENGPGELLTCSDVTLELLDDTFVAESAEIKASKFDLGAPLVKDGKQIGVLTEAASGDNAGYFLSVASILNWIEEETELSFSESD